MTAKRAIGGRPGKAKKGTSPAGRIPWPKRELYRTGGPRVYRGRQLDEIAFPLGGIGTGSVSLGGWGQLRDWEIFNRPAKGQMSDGSFFALWVQADGRPAVTKVLCGPMGGPLTGDGFGRLGRAHGAGLSHFRACTFTAMYPLARIDFQDPAVPLAVSLEAFNPFIPQNDRDSSIPCAIFIWTLSNPTRRRLRATLFANLRNEVGREAPGANVNAYRQGQAVRGLILSSQKHGPDSPAFGTMALATPHEDVTYQARWHRGGWFDPLSRFWEQARTGTLTDMAVSDPSPDKQTDVGSIGLRVTLAPGQRVRLPVILAWHFPNFEKYWQRAEEGGARPTWKNWYATQWTDAWDVAEYVGAHLDRLEGQTRLYHDTLAASRLPACVLDAVSSQTSTLKTATTVRLPDGTFYGWEGCSDQSGCCEGTCTHVWGYEQTLAYLFPALARSVHEANYAYNLHEDGHMTFRIPLPPGTRGDPGFHAAADGQLGGVMRVYREWRLSGDDAWLRRIWPSVRQALEYAWKQWDKDKDGVPEGVQHNTYDIEFLGPNTMIGSFYLGALRAGAAMARRVGDTAAADEYDRLVQAGGRWMDEHLFNGYYYVQQVRPEAAADDPRGFRAQLSDDDQKLGESMPKYQYGSGCLSDQMLGQWYADMLELGDLFDPKKIRKTAASIFRFNWRTDFFDHDNPQRIYACDGEAGLLVCSWPFGGKPAIPFPYSDEVWTGIEYATASFLIGRGLVDEGLAIVRGARARHDGSRRNPWNEYECGHHYARAMSAYGLLLALSGFRYAAAEQRIGFAPRLWPDDFRTFFSVGSGWGLYIQKKRAAGQYHRLDVRAGALTLQRLDLPWLGRKGRALKAAVQAAVGGAAVSAAIEEAPTGVRVVLGQPVTLQAGEALEVHLAG